MPSRGRKRASRQAQLSQKRRRARTGANARTFDPGPTQPREASPSKPAARGTPVDTTSAVAAPAPVQAATPRRQRGSAAQNTPMVYRYLGRELRQIGILASVMVAALIVLSFVLG